MKKLNTLLLSGILAASIVGIAVAQQREVGSAAPIKLSYHPVKAGEYRDFTFFRKVKLGLTPYVAPYAMKDISVVFHYEPKQFKSVPIDDIEPFLTSHRIGVVVFTGDSWSFKIANKSVLADVVASAKANSIKVSSMKPARIVSYEKPLLGKEPMGTMVSWDSKDPSPPIE